MLLTCVISSYVIWLKFCSHLTSFNNPKKLKKPNNFWPSPQTPNLGFGGLQHGHFLHGLPRSRDVRPWLPNAIFSRGNSKKKNRPELICWGKFDQQLMCFSDGKLPPETSPNVRGVPAIVAKPSGKRGRSPWLVGFAQPKPGEAWHSGIVGPIWGPNTLLQGMSQQYLRKTVKNGLGRHGDISHQLITIIFWMYNTSKMQMSCATQALKIEYIWNDWFETQEW